MTERDAASHRTARELVTPRRLREFFAPRSIALVGASDNSGWARFIVASCATAGFAGPLTAVHPRAERAFGLPVVPSLRDLPEPADLAFILAPVQAVEGVLDDMGAAGIPNAAEVRAGYEKVRTAGMAVPEASVDGVLVTPMRTGGAELLAGVTVDPAFGPVLAVGLGGIWVEVLSEVSLRLLPVDTAEVRRMLGELRGLPLLQGARGTRPADLDAVAEAIAGLGEAALSLTGTLRALEVNPLWVNGDQVEALDVLVVTKARDQP